MAKIAVAMSGGVDSSVTAMILKDQGHEVVGVTFKLSDISTDPETDAKTVCDFLGIEHQVFDYREDFKRIVVDPFIESYLNASTPNPCVVCNKGIKFGRFLEDALAMGCDFVATGHYAGTAVVDGRHCLKQADDGSKDQTYALYRLSQHQISRMILPLSHMAKADIRELAAQRSMPMAYRPDSQDICFIPSGDHGEFIRQNTSTAGSEGNFIDKNKNKIGSHKGIYHYTIGQRKGLGLSLGKPGFICDINPKTKEITVTTEESEIFSKVLFAENPVFSMVETLEGEHRVKAKIRYSHKPCHAVISMAGDKVRVVFDEAQRAVTPGQSVVFYKGDYVFGGGFILREGQYE